MSLLHFLLLVAVITADFIWLGMKNDARHAELMKAIKEKEDAK